MFEMHGSIYFQIDIQTQKPYQGTVLYSVWKQKESWKSLLCHVGMRYIALWNEIMSVFVCVVQCHCNRIRFDSAWNISIVWINSIAKNQPKTYTIRNGIHFELTDLVTLTNHATHKIRLFQHKLSIKNLRIGPLPKINGSCHLALSSINQFFCSLRFSNNNQHTHISRFILWSQFF